MDHRKALIETSIVIEHLRKKDKRKSMLFNIIDNHELFISSITVFELFAGATDEKKKRDIENIISNIELYHFQLRLPRKPGNFIFR